MVLTKKQSKFIFFISVILVVAILIIASINFGIDTVDKNDDDENVITKKFEISTTDYIQETSGSIGYSGGTISITDDLSPLLGLYIDVPEGAIEDTIKFDISYSDITEISGLTQDASIASKMINIETDGNDIWDDYKFFEKPCIVTLPYDPNLVDNEESVRFYSYDEESGQLEALGLISQDIEANTITFYVGTFSKFTAIEIIQKYEWFIENNEIDTGFRPKTDGWFIRNWGSYLSSGNCLGMSTYAKWYFTHKKTTAGNLYTKYIEGDEDEWRDDNTAIEIATRCQIGPYGIWEAINKDEKKYAIAKSPAVAFGLIHGMIVSGEPQIIVLATRFANGTWAKSTHAVLTYRFSGGRFDIYDPNFPGTLPGTDVRQIPFDYEQGFTKSYSSGKNAGSGAQYNIFFHSSLKTFSPKKLYQNIFEGAEKKFSDDSIFPDINLTDETTNPLGETPIDIDGDNIRDTGDTRCVISGTIKGGQKEVKSLLIFVSGIKYIVSVNNGLFSKDIPLSSGENEVIILGTDINTYYEWSGFHRETIKSTAFKSSFILTLTWDQDKSDLDLHVMEPTIEGWVGRHIYPHGGQGAGGIYPYMTIDNMQGYGPESYIATEDMTLPNYNGGGKSLYGTYKFRVHYMYDLDEDINTTQSVKWQVNLYYLAYEDKVKKYEYWEEKSWNGTLSDADFHFQYDFEHSGDDWSPIYEFEYNAPNSEDYGIPPPPQNFLPN